MLPVSLDCPFMITPSVFSNVYLSCVLCLMLPVSLDCPFLITPSVFSNVYLFCVVYPLLPVSLDSPSLITLRFPLHLFVLCLVSNVVCFSGVGAEVAAKDVATTGTDCISLVDGLELCSFKESEGSTELDGIDVKLHVGSFGPDCCEVLNIKPDSFKLSKTCAVILAES